MFASVRGSGVCGVIRFGSLGKRIAPLGLGISSLADAIALVCEFVAPVGYGTTDRRQVHL